MKRSAAPPAKTIQTLNGLILAKICEGDACVISQVECHLRVDDDGTWYVAFWSPSDPSCNASVQGSAPRENDAIARILAAISSLAPTLDV